MNNEMNIDEIIAEVDALLEAGEDAKAEKQLVEAIDKYTKVEPNNIVGQSVLLNELGGYYRNRGIFNKGEKAYLKAKGLLEEIRDHTYVLDGPAPVSGCCTCSAQSYNNLCCKDGNEKCQNHTENIYTNESMMANYATTLNNLAGLYRMSRQFEMALDTFDAAIAIYKNCEEGVSPDYIASVYNNKGLVYLDMQDTEKARYMFLKAKEILEKVENYKFALGTTVSNLGFAAVIEKEFSEAVELFEEAKVLFKEVGNCEMAQNCEIILSKLEVRQ